MRDIGGKYEKKFDRAWEKSSPVGPFKTFKPGNQPRLFVQAKTLPEAFQRTLQVVWERGFNVETSFDNKGDPPSKDATILVVIEDPFVEPRFHKLGWPRRTV